METPKIETKKMETRKKKKQSFPSLSGISQPLSHLSSTCQNKAWISLRDFPKFFLEFIFILFFFFFFLFFYFLSFDSILFFGLSFYMHNKAKCWPYSFVLVVLREFQTPKTISRPSKFFLNSENKTWERFSFEGGRLSPLFSFPSF